MAKAFDPFDAYATEERVVHIEAFNADVTVRDLTMGESDAFNKRLLKDYDGKGDPTIDLAEAAKINYEKIALAMLSPKKTVKELQAMGTSATKAIQEIIKAIDGKEDEVDDEGNSKD